VDRRSVVPERLVTTEATVDASFARRARPRSTLVPDGLDRLAPFKVGALRQLRWLRALSSKSKNKTLMAC
jgi:hypothetical protein